MAEDPMGREPAPAVMDPGAATERVMDMHYAYDWLANMTFWDDDGHQFYERSLGTIVNGSDLNEIDHAAAMSDETSVGGAYRPAALYFATNLDSSLPAPATDRGGYVHLTYGDSGNVQTMTVHAQCADDVGTCVDPGGSLSSRLTALAANCECAKEQHYQYRWDELNRLHEARRYDRDDSIAGADWSLAVRQRYRYDAGNVRTVKETIRNPAPAAMGDPAGTGGERVATLYVLPSDYERRGVVPGGVDSSGMSCDPSTMGCDPTWDLAYDPGGATVKTESQYLIAGTRIVIQNVGLSPGAGDFAPDLRMTYAVADMLGSTSAVVDLRSEELVELGTFYPNGARETLWVDSDAEYSYESVGFTGKEGDEEVGLTYFGERYLMPHLGRWASADPLSIHDAGGGEVSNAYHYVSGNLLQAVDPVGLDIEAVVGDDGNQVIREGRPEWSGSYADENEEEHDLGKCWGTRQQCEQTFANRARDQGILKTVMAIEGFAELLAQIVDPELRGQLIEQVKLELAREIIACPTCITRFADPAGVGMQLTVESIFETVGEVARNIAVASAGNRIDSAYASARLVVAAAEMATGRVLGLARRLIRNLPCAGMCFVAGTMVLATSGMIPIEDVRVGDRVFGEGGDQCIPDAGERRLNRLVLTPVMKPAAGGALQVVLLRDNAWIAEREAFAGGLVALDFWGDEPLLLRVESSEPVLIAPGEGCLVTGEFTSAAAELVDVEFEDGTQLTGTPTHLVWSVDAQDWRALHSFEPGDGMLVAGDHAQEQSRRIRVVNVSRRTVARAGTLRVYNIEVEQHHVFFAGRTPVLVHNCDGRPRAGSVGGSPGAGRRAVYRATDDGIVLPPGDHNLVTTATVDPANPQWLQIHQSHPHKGMNPHTHRPVVDRAPSGAARTRRVDSPTTETDIREADTRLRSGELRYRRGRRDRGGP